MHAEITESQEQKPLDSSDGRQSHLWRPCNDSDPFSTGKKKTKKLKLNDVHQGIVETMTLFTCFPLRNYPPL